MRLAICVAALAALAGPAAATTVTVDFEHVTEVVDGFDTVAFTDQGFETISSLLGWRGDSVLLGDRGIVSTSFRLNRFGTFTPKSIDIDFLSQIHRSAITARPDDGDDEALLTWAKAGAAAQAAIRLTGWFDGADPVSMDLPAGSARTVVFGEAFAGISQLDVDILFPSPGGGPIPLIDVRDVTEKGQAWCLEFCVGATLDTLVADVPAPIPLPASAVLLGGALALLGAARGRA